MWCNVNFESIFTAINNTKKQRKFKNYVFEKFFAAKTFGMDFRFPEITETSSAHWFEINCSVHISLHIFENIPL